jgi:hypothetical protein
MQVDPLALQGLGRIGAVEVADQLVAVGGDRVEGWAGSPRPAARRASARASGARSRALLGMHAQNAHSPPTSSRSQIATRRPPSASWLAAPRPAGPGADHHGVVSVGHWSLRSRVRGFLWLPKAAAAYATNGLTEC